MESHLCKMDDLTDGVGHSLSTKKGERKKIKPKIQLGLNAEGGRGAEIPIPKKHHGR